MELVKLNRKCSKLILLSVLLIVAGILVLIGCILQNSNKTIDDKAPLYFRISSYQIPPYSDMKKQAIGRFFGKLLIPDVYSNNAFSESVLQKGKINSTESSQLNIPNAKNVILFIGDGMGEEHRQAARWFSGGLNGRLAMDGLPASGFIHTFSADNKITDSAAAGTAMATGVKTNNGVIGLDMKLNSVPTILELAILQGKSVGIVTTTMVSHATPASFAAHVSSRKSMNEIAEQIIYSSIDVLLGGGEDEFYPKNESGCFPERGDRTDGKNLIQEALALGFVHVCDPTSFQQLDSSSTKRLIGLFADEGMIHPFSPSLGDMTLKAIEILSHNPNGYFLMVEGGQIDWASHANDASRAILNTISFDNAIKVTLEIPGIEEETLIIVTADHETGGMTTSLYSLGLSGEDGPFPMPDGKSFYVNWSTTGHTASPVPATATGPLSHWINGVHDNTYIFDLILSAMKGILDFNSLFLPADIDGDGILDHSSVCPYDGNWFIINNDKKAPIVIGSLEFITDIPHLGWGD